MLSQLLLALSDWSFNTKNNYIIFTGPFENPPSSRQEQRTPVNQPPVKNDDHMIQTQQDDIDMLIDEELAMWPKAG